MPGYSSRPLVDKLEIREDARVSVIGLGKDELPAGLESRAAKVTSGRVGRPCDCILWAVRERGSLARMDRLRHEIEPNGQIWVLWPREGKDLKEDDVRRAALPLGLVDIKVAAYSERWSALRLVIRKELRMAMQPKTKRPARLRRTAR